MIVAIDLDGTTCKYDGHYVHNKPGDPLEGALNFVKKLQERGHEVVVFTVRSNATRVQRHLITHGFPKLRVTKVKFGFDVLLDDRAINFPGPQFYADTDQAVAAIENFKPWWKK